MDRETLNTVDGRVEDEFLSRLEEIRPRTWFAEKMNCSERQVRRLAKRFGIRGVRIGRRVSYRIRDWLPHLSRL